MFAVVMKWSGRPHRTLALVGAALSLAAVVLPNLEIGTVHADVVEAEAAVAAKQAEVTALQGQLGR